MKNFHLYGTTPFSRVRPPTLRGGGLAVAVAREAVPLLSRSQSAGSVAVQQGHLTGGRGVDR